MQFRTKFIVPAVCMAAAVVFGQGEANVGKSNEELKKTISLGSLAFSDFRDKENKKFAQIKTTTEQDKDMGFDGAMRLTVELTGDTGEVWYGQVVKLQGKRRPDYIGEDYWQFDIPHGTLKYPQIVCALEYGYQTTNKVFVALREQLKKCESAEEIMKRNKGSKNRLKIKPTSRAEHTTNEPGGEGE